MTPPDFAVILPVTGSKKNDKVPTPRGIMPSAKSKRDKAAILEAIQAALLTPDPKRAGQFRMRTDLPLQPPYRVWLYLPTAHRTDSDNSAGHPMDCLTQCGVITDDAPVTDLRIVRESRADIMLAVWGATEDWQV